MVRLLPPRMPAMPKLHVPKLRRPPRFPPDFFFGVATSDHQCEAYDPRWEDIRDRWEQLDGRTPRGRATEFWERHPEDIALARDLGCRAFRFSIAWARVEPEPGRFDPEVLAHYRGMVDRIVAAGMIPIVTLHHFTWPVHVEDRGGMTAPGFPVWFAEYADRVAEALGEDVGYWITFNEPTYLPFGYVKLWGVRSYLLPPGMGSATGDQQLRAAAALIRNLFLAHRAARQRIRARHAAAKVGTNPFVLGFPRGLQAWLDRRASRASDPEAWVHRESRALKGYPDLVSGVVDVMFGAFPRTADQEAHMLFSEGYAEGRPAMMVLAGDPALKARDLFAEPVAVVRGGTAFEVLPRAGIEVEIRKERTLAGAVAQLRRGRVRAVLSDEELLKPAIAGEESRFRILPLEVPPHHYSAAVALNRDSLLKQVDAAIHEVLAERGQPVGVGEARLASVAAADHASPGHDFPRRDSRSEGPAPATRPEEAPPPRDTFRDTWLSGDPIAGVRRRGQLIVGVRRGGSPFAWRDPRTREWRGLEVEIARRLARRLLGDEKRVRFIPIDPMFRGGLVRGLSAPFEYLQRVLTVFSTLANTDCWYLGMAGRLPAFLCPPECAGELDFVGFDYYWGVPELRWDRVRGLLDSMRMQFTRAPVHPGGLRRLLQRYARTFPGKEILIVENGCIEKADGFERAEYVRAHLWEVQRALAAKIPVKGYVCWSITSNREWGLPFSPDSDFGLFHVDLDRDPELRRHPTPAAEALREIVRHRDALPREDEALRVWMKRLGVRLKAARRASRRAVSGASRRSRRASSSAPDRRTG